MAEQWPKIRSRRTIAISRWMNVIAREVEFTAGAEPQLYHAVAQLDYLAIVALTPDGRIPIVRQYGPPSRRLPGSCRQVCSNAGGAGRRLRARIAGGNRLSGSPVHALGRPLPPAREVRQPSPLVFYRDRRAGRRFHTRARAFRRAENPAELAALIKSGAFVQQLHLVH